MGIAPYKTFIFDGESSIDYGVYLTGEGVFNAPERAVEMITIPGRNGAFALDQGRFENIEITYKAGMVDVNESNFADKMSAFRNWLCSKVGYCRLEDDYNPNEFRMAVFKNGIKVDHDFLIAGEFEITFECKPQRYLTSGETAEAVTSGSTVTNPTLFDASPLLEVEGYGKIHIADSTIEVTNGQIGNIQITEKKIKNVNVAGGYGNVQVDFIANSPLNTNDVITVSGVEVTFEELVSSGYTLVSASVSNTVNCDCSITENGRFIKLTSTPVTFSYGSGGLSVDVQVQAAIDWKYLYNGSENTLSGTLYFHIIYYPTGDKFLINNDAGITSAPFYNWKTSFVVPEIYADSTKSALGHPTYIDLDIGEAWNNDYGRLISVNNVVNMPGELPKLPSGNTTITFDNTITDFDIVPRWWKL